MRIFLILFYCIYLVNLTAQTENLQPLPSEINSIFQKIVKEGYHEITLESNFKELINNRKTKEEQKATITFISSTKEKLTMPVKVRTRGIYRRDKCKIPPLRLNFSKKKLKQIGVHPKFDKLKLVLNCLDSSKSEQAVLRELIAYQLYNQTTKRSFKVQLIKINLIEASDHTTKSSGYAFLIENNHEMAHRIGGEILDTIGVSAKDLDPTAYHNSILFNYMIGNLDVNYEMQKNTKYVKLPNAEKLIVVSYDFDYSAFVYPKYIKTNANYGQKNIFQRFTVGEVIDKEKFMEISAFFLQLEPIFFSNINKHTVLNNKSKRHIKIYLKSFFRALKKGKLHTKF